MLVMLETFRKVWLGFISEMLARGIAESVLLSSFIPANRWKWVVSPPPPKKKYTCLVAAVLVYW